LFFNTTTKFQLNRKNSSFISQFFKIKALMENLGLDCSQTTFLLTYTDWSRCRTQ